MATAKKLAVKKSVAKKTAVKPPVPRIFQIYFEPWQRELLDKGFKPLDNSGASAESMEFAVFERLEMSEAVKDAELWGALSWRFSEKTGMTGKELLAQIKANPGYDVYFCNPHLGNEAIHYNMWLQGETSHPHFLSLVSAVFKAAGLDEQELTALHPSSSYSAANYFVATPKFWRAYIAFIRKVLKAADKNLSPELLRLLHSKSADPNDLHAGATYVPFIVERLFGYFMRTKGSKLKPFKLVLSKREAELNVHQKLLREMKDMAFKTKSPWLAACWVNYRNLYLSQTQTKPWCNKYLRVITPTKMHFV
jgi:hypothetical protein